ncbi:MAG: hypothetical protein LBS45_05340 [Synergistaceae bacterium]|nr:hypothetical protein [Synergistaceae bacterium]
MKSVWIVSGVPIKEISAAFFLAVCIVSYANPARSEVQSGDWVGETRGILSGLIARRGASPGTRDVECHDGIWVSTEGIIALGEPAYRHLLGAVTRESAYAMTFFADRMPRVITGELSKVVPFGGVPLDLRDFGTDGSAKKMLTEASEFLPRRWLGWIVYLNRKQGIAVRRSTRGEYRAGAIRTNNLKTSLHELVHAYEDKPFAAPDRKLKLEFYGRRTEGKKLRHLSRITNLYFYGTREKFRSGFVWRYLGKEHGEELMSAGIECLMWNRFDIWNRDPELVKFLLGMLIFFGR